MIQKTFLQFCTNTATNQIGVFCNLIEYNKSCDVLYTVELHMTWKWVRPSQIRFMSQAPAVK